MRYDDEKLEAMLHACYEKVLQIQAEFIFAEREDPAKKFIFEMEALLQR